MLKRQLLVASLIAGTLALTACGQAKEVAESTVEKTGDIAKTTATTVAESSEKSVEDTKEIVAETGEKAEDKVEAEQKY